MNKRKIELWDSSVNFELQPESSFQEMVLCRPDSEYHFLHDCAIISFRGTLFVAWYNCPEGEMLGKSVIRGRCSEDGGRTWSEIMTFASSSSGKYLYVPPAFASDGNRLFLIVSRMTGPDRMEDFEIFQWDTSSCSFQSVRIVDEPFLPNTQAFHMKNGKWIIGGRWTAEKGSFPECPAVAICDSQELSADWRVVKIHDRILPDGSTFLYPEPGLFVEDSVITAIVRNDHGQPLLFQSMDFGETWEGPFYHNLPLAPVKAAAGILPDGRRYVIGNPVENGRRTRLMIAFSEKGEKLLSHARLLQDGVNNKLNARPEWSYPSAWVDGSSLYIVYTSEKTSAVMTVIPISELY